MNIASQEDEKMAVSALVLGRPVAIVRPGEELTLAPQRGSEHSTIVEKDHGSTEAMTNDNDTIVRFTQQSTLPEVAVNTIGQSKRSAMSARR